MCCIIFVVDGKDIFWTKMGKGIISYKNKAKPRLSFRSRGFFLLDS